MSQIIIEPITEATLTEFSLFLHNNLNKSRTVEQWAAGLKESWREERPNYGFLIRDNNEIVGGIGAFYKTRKINGNIEKFCNITSWCVLDEYRQHSMRLAMSIINQPDYHFTDFTPTKVVSSTLKFFKFVPLDSRETVVLNLPLNFFYKRNVIDKSDEIEKSLRGDALQIYKDHAVYPWLNHILIRDSDNYCHVIFKKITFKKLPAAFIYYMSNKDLFNQYYRQVFSYFFFKGYVSTHVENRFFENLLWHTKTRSGFNAKLFFSETLSPKDIDYLYSELMALDL